MSFRVNESIVGAAGATIVFLASVVATNRTVLEKCPRLLFGQEDLKLRNVDARLWREGFPSLAQREQSVGVEVLTDRDAAFDRTNRAEREQREAGRAGFLRD